MSGFQSKVFKALFLCLVVIVSQPVAADKLPPELAGEIPFPSGQIAFIRNGDIWVMDALGTNQRPVCQVSNAEGRLSWSPDNERIVFTRSGLVDIKGPDLTGGRHKVYDLFMCYLDSAEAGNTKFWTRLTTDLGSRGPEWNIDGRTIIFWRDMNANRISSRYPNYQLCVTDPAGDSVILLRHDWQQAGRQFLVTPSMNSRGDIAFVFFDELQPGGLVVLARNDISVPLDTIRAMAVEYKGYVAPAWSPDGQWLASVCDNPGDSGLCIVGPDLKTGYLVTPPPESAYIDRQSPSFSPDSKWITFSTSDGSIWMCDITGNGLRRLTSPGPDHSPCWSH